MLEAQINIPGPLMNVSVGGEVDDDCLGVDANPAVNIDELLAEKLRDLAAEQTRQVSSAINTLQTVVNNVNELRSQVIAEAEDELVQLAMDIAESILAQEIRSERYEIDPIVAQALSALPSRRDVVVYLNADDLAQCSIAQSKQDSTVDGGLKFTVDIALKPGECRVETAEATIDATISGKMHQIQRTLIDSSEVV